MSAKRHAGKDCKWFKKDWFCIVELDDLEFDPILGFIKATKFCTCCEKNEEGSCEYFKPSLKARFWKCMGVEYERYLEP